ncbi:hypothetical protein BRDID11002_59630 [Bradyrhizobium diazoefficiens]|uniref:Uncharacterized protein n=1 Tax=Bradyrhizobium diazoefficiens TaxID=1355477 RepID=A0A809WR99_9BRAD|nr:hypothetical protein XF1B_05030 [Bradyrhizobium diazoefficiens]BCF22550.1 hypothetical protein XF14B_05020 [Bradyrhizobium diazoefficiens]
MPDRGVAAWFLGAENVMLKLFKIDLLARAKAEIARKDKELAREIAGRFSRGNLSIQRGRFLTADDLEKRKQAVANYRFKK